MQFGSIAQLGEHLPYKQRVTGSSPVVPTISKVEIPWIINGPVVQLVRTPACHAGGRRFEPVSGRHFADIAQSVECILGKDEVTGSNPVISSTCKPLNLGVWRFFLLRENCKNDFVPLLCHSFLSFVQHIFSINKKATV